MAALTGFATAAATNSLSKSVSALIPAGAGVGDIAVASINSALTTLTMTAPTGWTLQNSTTGSAGITWIYTHTVASGEPGVTSPTWTLSGNSGYPTLALRTYSGVVNTGSVSETGVTTASTSFTLPTLNPSAGTLLDVSVLARAGSATSAVTVTIPSGSYTTAGSVSTNVASSPNMAQGVAYHVVSSSGVYGGQTATVSSASTGEAYLLSLPAVVNVSLAGVLASAAVAAPAGAVAATKTVNLAGPTAQSTVSALSGAVTTQFRTNPPSLGAVVYYQRDGIQGPAVPIDLSGTNAVSLVFDMDYTGGDTFGGMAFEFSPTTNANDGFFFSPGSEFPDGAGKGEVDDKGSLGFNIKQFPRPSAGVHRYILVIDRSLDGGVPGPFRLYIDGVLQSVSQEASYTADNSNNFTSDTLYVAHRGATNASYLNGGITIPTVLSHAVTQEEVDYWFGGSLVAVTAAGSVAQATAGALAGSVATTKTVAVAGLVGATTAVAPAGTLVVGHGAAMSGVLASASASALSGSVTAVRNLTTSGPVAIATANALAGTATTTSTVAAAGPLASVSAAAPSGGVVTTSSVTLSTSVASAAAVAPSGPFVAGHGVAPSGALATTTAAGLSGSVTAIRNMTFIGPVATAAASAVTGGLAVGGSVTLAASPALAGVTAPAGTVAAIENPSLAGPVATATASALAGAVDETSNVTLTGPTASVSARAVAGGVQTRVNATALPARVTAAALAGSVSGSATVTGAATVADATAPAGQVTTTKTVNVVGPVAQAAASAASGTASVQRSVAVAGQSAQAAAFSPAGFASAIQNVTVIAPVVPVATTAPAGTVVTTANVTIAGLVAMAEAQALAGLISGTDPTFRDIVLAVGALTGRSLATSAATRSLTAGTANRSLAGSAAIRLLSAGTATRSLDVRLE